MVEPPAEGEMVRTPPPTVETMVRLTLLVLVTTSPRVREGDWLAGAEVDVVGVELEPAAIAPLDEVVEVVVEGVFWLAAAAVEPVSPTGVDVVLEVVSPP